MAWFGNILPHTEELLSTLVMKAVVAIAVLLVGIIAGNVLGKLSHRMLHELRLNSALKRAGVSFGLEGIAAKFVQYFIYFITLLMVLNQFGVATTVLNMIAGVVLLFITAVIILSIKDFIPNFLAGIALHKQGKLQAGDSVCVGDIEGKIIQLSLLEMKIKTRGGDTIFIPNSAVIRLRVVRKKR